MMLLSLAMFAVVGGALAFKAKYSQEYCTTNTSGNSCPSGLACKIDTPDIKLTSGAGTFVCTTTFSPGCKNNCTTEASTKITGDLPQ